MCFVHVLLMLFCMCEMNDWLSVNKGMGMKSCLKSLAKRISHAPSTCYGRVILGADDGVAKSDGGDVGGTWLQLMCCALPKHLCP